jgi:hypothetical protein
LPRRVAASARHRAEIFHGLGNRTSGAGKVDRPTGKLRGKDAIGVGVGGALDSHTQVSIEQVFE